MKTKLLIAIVVLAAGCSGGQTTSDGVPDNTSTAPTSTPTQTVTATTPPTQTPTQTPSTTPTTPPTPSSSASTAPTTSGSSSPTAGPPDAKNGEKLFTDNKCDGCHGSKAKPGRVPLFALKWNDDEKKKAAGIIRKGKGEMPKFEGKLNDQQIADLVAFVSSK